MKRCFQLFLVLWIGIAANPLADAARAAASLPFEDEIVAFEQADKTNPPPQGGILFVGSSLIRKWTTLAQDLPAHKVFNRGFGGSQLSDSIYYFDRIVLPYKPKLIVLYAGSNDINSGKTPETVVQDFETFARKVESELPDTKLDYISINTNPSRWEQVEKVKKANREIADFIAKDKKLAFINTFPAMLDPEGKPRPELFVEDRLHLNSQGYKIWTAIIEPYLSLAE